MNSRWRSSAIRAGDSGRKRVVVGRFHAHGDARQPRPRSSRSVSGGSRSMRVSIENWIFRGSRPIRSANANDLLAMQTEQRIAKLERAEAPAADALPHFLDHRLRVAEPRGISSTMYGQ